MHNVTYFTLSVKHSSTCITHVLECLMNCKEGNPYVHVLYCTPYNKKDPQQYARLIYKFSNHVKCKYSLNVHVHVQYI